MMHPDYTERTITYQGQEHRFRFEHADGNPERDVPPRATAYCDERFFGYITPHVIEDIDGYGGLRWGIHLSRGDMAGGATLNMVLRTGLELEAERRAREAHRG